MYIDYAFSILLLVKPRCLCRPLCPVAHGIAGHRNIIISENVMRAEAIIYK